MTDVPTGSGDRLRTMTHRGRRTILGAAGSTTLSVIPPFLLGSLLPFMRDEMRLDSSRLGLLVGVYFAAGALAAVPGGLLAERLAPRRALLLANGLTAVSMLSIAALSRNWIHLGVAMAVAGWANGTLQPAGNLALMRGVRLRRQGLAFGIKQSAGPSATMLAGLAIPTLAVTVGWRWAFVGTAFALPLVALILPADERVPQRAERPRPRHSKLLLTTVAVAAGLGFASATTVGTFLVEGVVVAGGTPQIAATALISASVACIAIRLLVGWHTDRSAKPNLATVAILLAGGAIGFVALTFAAGPVFWLVGAVVALGFGWGWPGLLHHAVAAANPEAPAAATGVTTVGVAAGAVVGPVIFGFVAKQASFAAAWTLSAVFAVLGASVLVGVHRYLQRTTTPA